MRRTNYGDIYYKYAAIFRVQQWNATAHRVFLKEFGANSPLVNNTNRVNIVHVWKDNKFGRRRDAVKNLVDRSRGYKVEVIARRG